MPPLRLSRGLALAVTLGLAAAPGSLAAQRAVASGRVILPHGSDTSAVPLARVILHRVGRDRQGPVDSAVSDAGGRFRFTFLADTGALFLLSARYGGIEYFSPPVHTAPALPDTGLRVTVYDTSSTAPIGVTARHIVVPTAGRDGSRSVLDLIVLGNDGILARVAPDSAHPSWSIALPEGVAEMEVGESDLSPDAVARVGDSVHVLAPLAPGQKQLSLEYVIPATRRIVDWPVGPGATTLNLLVEDRGAKVSGAGLAPADSEVVEGRTFRRFTGRVPAGATVRLELGGARPVTGPVLGGLVAAVAGVLAVAAWRLVRRPTPARAGAPAADAERLLDEIAALDARFASRVEEATGPERDAYAAERSRLKAALERALAGARASR